jgi:glycosyltransferase involved in cell wall biosynthesis
MRRALCMLLPSQREGYGMVVVEASAHATPNIVVAGDDKAATEDAEEPSLEQVRPATSADGFGPSIAHSEPDLGLNPVA